MPSLVTERIESVKAGILSSAVFGIAEMLAILANNSLEFVLRSSGGISPQNSLFDICTSLAIAFVSGFLFGVTYRYIIRGDRNSHLKDGAVLAFGLVRGFALIEGTNISLLWLLLVAESAVSFAIARYSLDLALQFKLLKPFV